MKYKNLKYTFNVAGLAVVVFLAIKEFCYLVLSRISFSEGSVVSALLYIAVFIVSCIVPVVIMENMLGLHPKLFRKTEPTLTAGAVTFGYLLILAAGVINNLVLAALSLAGLNFAPREMVFPQGILRLVIYYIYVCVLPALLEEIFIRGYVLNSLKSYGTAFAVVASSACFALMHANLENFVVYFACGVILALVYLTFDSLLPAMALHCVNNSISFFLSYFRLRINAVSALSMITTVYVFVIALGFNGYRILKKNNIKLTGCICRDGDAKGKLAVFAKSYVAVAALCLLLFFAALGSYNSMI